jgi:hypothetical protein
MYTINFNVPSRHVSSYLPILHIVSSKTGFKIIGMYKYHIKTCFLTQILGLRRERYKIKIMFGGKYFYL